MFTCPAPARASPAACAPPACLPHAALPAQPAGIDHCLRLPAPHCSPARRHHTAPRRCLALPDRALRAAAPACGQIRCLLAPASISIGRRCAASRSIPQHYYACLHHSGARTLPGRQRCAGSSYQSVYTCHHTPPACHCTS